MASPVPGFACWLACSQHGASYVRITYLSGAGHKTSITKGLRLDVMKVIQAESFTRCQPFLHTKTDGVEHA